MNNVSIATICWVRSNHEEEVLKSSLSQLAKLNLPVYITDGGSSESFVRYLRTFSNFTVLQARGLWPQVMNSVNGASSDGAKFIFYTEPDKLDFFSSHVAKMLQYPVNENTGIVLASRSSNGFSTFPSFQQITETAINQCCKEVIEEDVDYCYGPFLFSAQLIPFLNALDTNIGWGWRPFLFAIAHRSGFKIESLEGDFNCPADQRNDDKLERIYRMKQLTQNIQGLTLAATMDLPKTI